LARWRCPNRLRVPLVTLWIVTGVVNSIELSKIPSYVGVDFLEVYMVIARNMNEMN
jgi:hypothetical protein